MPSYGGVGSLVFMKVSEAPRYWRRTRKCLRTGRFGGRFFESRTGHLRGVRERNSIGIAVTYIKSASSLAQFLAVSRKWTTLVRHRVVAEEKGAGLEWHCIKRR
jgi:hypothetical protein